MSDAPGPPSVETHIAGCALCREELALLREEIGSFALAEVESAGLEAPSARSRDRLMAQIAPAGANWNHASASTPGPVPVQSPVQTPALGGIAGGAPRLAASRIPAWLGWAVAASMTLAAIHFYQQREATRARVAAQAEQIARLSANEARAHALLSALVDPAAQRVSLSLTKAAAPPQPSARATYLAGKGTLILLASHLDPLPEGKTYELWVIPASGKAPVPAGVFRPDERGNATVVTARLAGVGAAKAIGVTIEAAGGSATPTLPIVLAGS
jgi:anti-sigma-K factor RskA